MKRRAVYISGVRFDPIMQTQLIDDIARHVTHPSRRSFLVVKPYVEFLAAAQADASKVTLINQADRVVADGVAIQWAASYLYGRRGPLQFAKSLLIDIQRASWREQVIPERGAGVTATQQLLKHAEQAGWRVGILGGPRDTAATFAAVQKRYSQLKLVTVESGYFPPDEEAELVFRLKKCQLDLLFVAMGFPRQEEFMVRQRDAGVAHVMLGEGGTFDFDEMGGPLKRAPKAIRRVGLEWLWRLFRQPSRASRQVSIPRFLHSIYREGKEK